MDDGDGMARVIRKRQGGGGGTDFCDMIVMDDLLTMMESVPRLQNELDASLLWIKQLMGLITRTMRGGHMEKGINLLAG